MTERGGDKRLNFVSRAWRIVDVSFFTFNFVCYAYPYDSKLILASPKLPLYLYMLYVCLMQRTLRFCFLLIFVPAF